MYVCLLLLVNKMLKLRKESLIERQEIRVEKPAKIRPDVIRWRRTFSHKSALGSTGTAESRIGGNDLPKVSRNNRQQVWSLAQLPKSDGDLYSLREQEWVAWSTGGNSGLKLSEDG